MMILSGFWVLIYLCVFTCKGFLNAVEATFECKKDSELISECTKTSNAICQCRTGFIRRNDESSLCKCAKGSGLDTSGLICRECKEGSFSTKMDSKCVKWRECRSGVRILGSVTSDVTCNENSEPEGKALSSTHTTSPSGSIQTFSKSLIQSQRSSPHPDVPTLTPAPTIKVTKSPKFSTADFGQVMTLVGIVLLLTFLLTTVTCKLITIPCIKNHKKPAVRKSQDSMCRRPVEESGDSSFSSLVKQPSLGEP
ncbi:tumor necrosis factor receptor superfamily member 1B-like isoform X2 [Oncorhynchus tshawytscha]|uniref:tumor necrosis factor receptor superfamily member 1B-like isoform X2 n=1 Tax=Oncorhynchus tshawytscha TaxID=74940 RepID=UPI000D099F1A|nr:tumor necrosis factor receptor superfamily member 1B-like isoform X2 [Oncorhynchus tshawytscha]